MANKYKRIFKTDTLGLSLGKDGYWLYDETRKMNLAMRSKTEREALLEALEYYQKRLLSEEQENRLLRSKINSFLIQFNVNYDSDGYYPEETNNK